LSHLSANY